MKINAERLRRRRPSEIGTHPALHVEAGVCARFLRASVCTILRWNRHGYLPSIEQGLYADNHKRFRIADALAFWERLCRPERARSASQIIADWKDTHAVWLTAYPQWALLAEHPEFEDHPQWSVIWPGRLRVSQVKKRWAASPGLTLLRHSESRA
jgi:hypothetical protein